LSQNRAKIPPLVCALVVSLACSRGLQAEQMPDVKELTYNWRGYKIYYKTAGRVKQPGEETAAPLIFLHGFGASSFTWRHNLLPLAERHKVVALDLLGFGKSDKPRIEYTPEIWVNLVNEFIRANHFPKVTLIGNDLGGLVAARFALKFPDKTEKLVLVDSLGLSYSLSRTQRIVCIPVIGRASFRLFFRRGYVGRVLRKSIYAEPHKVTEDVIEGHYRPFLSPGAAYAYRNVAKNIRQWELGDRFKEIAVPTLIVWGEDDRIAPIEDAAELTNLIPARTIVTIPGAGHYPHEESPQQFNSTLARYLERPASGDSAAR